MSVTIQQRRDLAANWASTNPVLNQGEIGAETDTGKAKLGDGATAWNSLAYWSPSGSTGAVDSVNGQTGVVVLTAAEVGADASGAAATAQANAEAASLPLPSGTPSAGEVPVFTGSGYGSAAGLPNAGDAATGSKYLRDDGAWDAAGFGVIIGALPTGETASDTPALQAMITLLENAGGHRTLQLCDGTYQVDSNALVIRNCTDFKVRGACTFIEQAPNRAGLVNNTSGDLLVIADCTDFEVEDVVLDGLRDTLAPMTPLSASASSGQAAVTVASGSGANYLAGQKLFLFGGLGTAEQNQQEGFATAGAVTPLVILSISPGGGSGGGDKITFTTNLSNSYAQISSTPFSDGFGPYAYAGAYLTPYQVGNATVAGRTLFGEDQQNGLHLLSCKRFGVHNATARNLWESPVRLGSGYEATSLTDGCSQGAVTGCMGYHAYDQGVALWVSDHITISGCVLNATGWAGISLTGSDYCTVTGNQILSPVYRVPGDAGSGTGIVTEGGLRNQITGNIVSSPYQYGIETIHSPLTWGLNNASLPATSTFLEAGTAAGTSVQVSATSAMVAGGRHSLLDGAQTEAVTIASIVDGTHVTFAETLAFSHASAVSIGSRVAQENVVAGNTVRNAGSQGIMLVPSVRGVIKNNTVTGSGSYGIAPDYTVGFRPNTSYPAGDGTHLEGNVVGNGAGAGIRANGVTQLQVRGNRIHSPGNFGGGIELHGVTDSVIKDNYIADVVGSYGIVAESGGASSTPSARLAISGNSIHRTQLQGICLTLGDSYTVAGNVVQSCRNNGIDLQGVTNSVVQGNISNSNDGTGILLENSSSTGCSGNRVTGNTTRDDGTGVSVVNGATFTQQHGIQETGNSNSNLITANESDSNAVDQLTTAGAATYAWSNIISGLVVPGTPPPLAVYAPSGLTGATAASRYAGATSSGAPGSGTFATGDYVVDRSGAIWICTAGGSPGTWVEVGSGSFPGFDSTAAHILAAGAQAAGSNDLAADSGHVHPATSWVPADNGFLVATGDPGIYQNSQTLVAGTLYLIKLPIRVALTITNLWWIVNTGGSGTSAGSYTGLYSSSGTLLSGSSDLVTPLTSSGTHEVALTSAQALTAGTFVWAALLCNLSSSQAHIQDTNARSDVLNANLGASAYRVAVNAALATTVASGSNGGEISAIASWSSPSAGVLDVASTTGFPSSGTIAVAASGTTLAEVTYTGTSGGNQFTGCAYVSGSATGTLTTGGAVTNAALPASINPNSNSLTGTFGFWVAGS